MKGSSMAGANLPAKKYSKTTPTETRLVFEFPAGATGGYIDIAQALSAVNRRFYRQGVYYYVNSFEIQNLEDGYVDLKIAPDTWATQQSWKRAFSKFQEMNALVDTPRPKYHDFKIFLDSTHRNNVNSGTYNRLPTGVGSVGNVGGISSDEWMYSQFVNMNDRAASNSGTAHVTTPNQFNMHVVGDHVGTGPAEYDSVGMIYSYAVSRAFPDSDGEPNIFPANDDDPLSLLFQGSEVHALEEVSEHLDLHNDHTPYDATIYYGMGDNHLTPLRRMQTGAASTGRTHEVSGACVPFGLIRVDSVGYSSSWRLILNIASGTYNGVYAERV
jgi:hypothetical protein